MTPPLEADKGRNAVAVATSDSRAAVADATTVTRSARTRPRPRGCAAGRRSCGLGPAAAWAPALASHGVAVLSIAYFGVSGLAAALARIDVEVVGRAAGWLRRQPGVAPGAGHQCGGVSGTPLAPS